MVTRRAGAQADEALTERQVLDAWKFDREDNLAAAAIRRAELIKPR